MQEAGRLFRAGKLEEAERHYAAVLQTDPGNFDALNGLGLVRSRQGDFVTAERLLGDALALRPDSAELLYNRGSLLHRLGRNGEALTCFGSALALRPGYAEAFANRGAVLMDMGRYEDGLADFTQATTAKPELAQGWINRGAAFSKLARHREAHASYSKALSLNPDLAEARRARAWISFLIGQHAEALSDVALITARDPGDALAWKLRADILAQIGRREAAVESYARAIALRPDYTDALYNRATNLFGLMRFEEAAQDYATVVAVDPDYRYGLGSLLFAKRCCCDWRALPEETERLRSSLAAGIMAAQPFQTFICCDSEEILRVTRTFAAAEYPPRSPLASATPYTHDRVRVGYLSGNFHSHAVARLMAGVFEHHDHARFEISAFSLGPDDGRPLRRRLMSAFSEFVDCRHWNDDRIAREIRAREIDVLVDLMGFTENSRPGIVAQKPAPVQVNFLGFPGTMAADYMDYLIADSVVIPEESGTCYSENIIRLPHSYLAADDRREIGPAITRTNAGLPEQGFIFCCFNHSYKIAPEIFGVWMRLLRDTPGACLWLSNLDPAARRNLLATAQDQGVDSNRIIVAPYVAEDSDHLARLALADLFLDTPVYNAHATASDALWAGVPVLTVSGETFPGRVGASLLHAIGLEELIAPDLESYYRIAVSLARDPARIAQLKAQLALNKNNEPLFNTRLFTRAIENALDTAVARHRDGLVPVSFAARTPT